MKTLKDLNEKAWYRFSKIVYIGLFSLSYLFLVLLGLFELGRDYHPSFYPKTIEIALNDPEFYKVSDYNKRNALKDIDREFSGSLSLTDQEQFIEKVKRIDIKTKEIINRDLIDDIVLSIDAYKSGTIDKAEEVVSIVMDRIFVAVPRKNPIPQEEAREKYIYASYYTWNIEKSIIFFVIVTLFYSLFMVIIRSVFYYVAIGKLFPKE